ncbi:Snaclec stejaggregin-B subunit alpha [Dirofilaria immitis]
MIIPLNFYILVLFLKEITGRLCNDGWIYFQPTKYCYLLIEKPTNFNKAQFVCLIKAANLVSIHNEVENRFVSEMIAKIGQPIWLGAAIFDRLKMHENVDLSPFDYTNWQNGTQPIYEKSRPCVKISSENRKWFSDCCYKKPVPYMCKKLAEKGERLYLNKTINITNNINPKFANKYGSTVVKQQKAINKANDTVFSLVTNAYDNKNNSNKVISARKNTNT